MKANRQQNNSLQNAGIIKTEGIISLTLDAKLSEAISKFRSSHDAVMVVEEGRFFGLVNPYYCLIKRTYPPQTKLKNCLFSPPKLSLDTPVEKAAKLMLESKVHYLPVVDQKDRLLGIVTARRILRWQKNAPKAVNSILDLVSGKPYLQTININSGFEEVLRFFQRSRLSKIIIVNDDNNLQGIISFFDLLSLFREPKQRKQFFDRGENVAQFANKTIKHFLKTSLIKLEANAKIKTAINLILQKEIGSVIVMKNSLEPLNIVTTSDLLVYLLAK
jgi:CBS domain-containing protein